MLPGGRHALTAEHCAVLVEAGVTMFRPRSLHLRDERGTVVVPVKRVHAHPGASLAVDLAVVELARPAPQRFRRHDICRSEDEIGGQFTKVTYGPLRHAKGGVRKPEPGRLAGLNRYDTSFDKVLPRMRNDHWLAKDLRSIPGFDARTMLVYDFDNGSRRHDAMGVHAGIRDTGFGAAEVGVGGGDSGSPGLVNGRICGITTASFTDVFAFQKQRATVDAHRPQARTLKQLRAEIGAARYDELVAGAKELRERVTFENLYQTASDSEDLGMESSFGYIMMDARVSAAARWIDNVLAGRTS